VGELAGDQDGAKARRGPPLEEIGAELDPLGPRFAGRADAGDRVDANLEFERAHQETTSPIDANRSAATLVVAALTEPSFSMNKSRLKSTASIIASLPQPAS